LLLTVSALAIACGVPISAEEITATAVQGDAVEAAALAQGATGGPGPLEQVRILPAGSTPPVLAPAIATPTRTATPLPTVATNTLRAFSTDAGTPTADGTPAVAGSPTAVAGSGLAAEALRAVNQVRTSSGRQALRQNATLTASADKYARYMAEKNFFAHDGLDGSTPASRLTASGYAGHFRGEALAAGQTSGQSAVNTWMNSPAHATVVLDPTASEVGIGYFYLPGSFYGHYWVLVVGAP
jgi:uncharacterized protein YkwD